jgi:hypothetical protein
MTSELIAIPSAAKTAALFPAAELVPALVAAAGERASIRFLEFFAANIRNPHTRRAYARAADEFLAWCASAGVPSIGAVQPARAADLRCKAAAFRRDFGGCSRRPELLGRAQRDCELRLTAGASVDVVATLQQIAKNLQELGFV